MLIDSHCHLDFDALSCDIDGVLARMSGAGVGACVTISTRIKQFDKIIAIAEKYDNVYCSVGTHPHNAHEELDIELSEIIELSKHKKCVAIGEVGLDYHYDNSPREAQREGFLRHIAAARETKLPLIIHSRSADDDMIEILQSEMGKGAFPFILHCFSSGKKLAEVGLELGGYLSFSGILTFKNANEIHQVAQSAPMDRLLVETDAPYLAPVPHRGKSNEPAYVRHTAEHLANLRNVSLEEISKITTNNFTRLFKKVNM
ncbi:MAG: TatD family hydrolase [Devosiaceae bacterium]|nr:TatD family hydrolase [Devosiaceae bacterium]